MWEAGALTTPGSFTGAPLLDLFLGAIASSATVLFTDVSASSHPSVFFHPSLASAVRADAFLAATALGSSLFPAFLAQLGGSDVLKLQTVFLHETLVDLAGAAQPAQFYAAITSVTPTFFPLMLAVDPILLILELFFVAAFCLTLNRLAFFQSGRQLFYDDLVTLCKYNNLSLTEIAVTTTLAVGFIFFDIFVSFGEEDVIDSLNYLILLFVILTFVFLILAVDVQYFFMVSNAGGDLTLRVIIFDLVNNILCALRVFFC